MNYSPGNEQGLLGLITALKQGMDPSTAVSMYQMIQSDQAAAIAARQQRLAGLSSLLMQGASEGMPYAGAEALAQAAPGPFGPAAQNILSSLYPDQNAPTSAYLPEAAQQYPGLVPPEMRQDARAAAAGQATSPIYMPPQPSITEQLAMQEAVQQQATDAAWAEVQADAAKAKSQGWTPDQFVATVAQDPANAAVLASDPARLKAILINTFGQIAFNVSGAPGAA